MANVRNEKRPLSPHLSIWKWGPHMATSIIHRATGTAMATVGVVIFTLWLVALATNAGAYADFLDLLTYRSGALNAAGWVLGVGFTLVFFQHMASGVRHFFLDVGANFELGGNKRTAILTWVFAVVATAGYWILILEKQ